jgi:sugar phosphate isomerase/epimerase
MSERLVASYWTLAGAPFGQPARWPFEERVRAAAEAGFRGIGMHFEDYRAMRQRGISDDDVRDVINRHGIVVDEIEFLSGWSSDDEKVRGAAREAEAWLFELADAVGARQLNVGCSELREHAVPVERMAERFEALCGRASLHNLVVAIEFLPWSGIADAETAWRVVDASSAPNGGVLLDSWHFFRGNPDYEALTAIPAERILGLQINDGPAVPIGEIREETRHGRRLPGEGDFDLPELVSTVRGMGVQARWAVEVMSALQASLPVDVAARAAFERTRRIVAV